MIAAVLLITIFPFIPFFPEYDPPDKLLKSSDISENQCQVLLRIVKLEPMLQKMLLNHASK